MKPLTDLPLDAFVGLHVWIAPPSVAMREGDVVAARSGPKGPLLTISCVNDLSSAALLNGRTLMARPEDLPAEVLVDEPDIVGLTVTDVDRGLLGIVTDVIITGANDVWVVEGDTYGEVLIPIIDVVLLDVDFDANRATVRLLPGLIDDRDDI